MKMPASIETFRKRSKTGLDRFADWSSGIIWTGFRTVDRYFSRTDDPIRQQQPRSWIVAPMLLFFFLLFGPCPRLEDASWGRRAFMIGTLLFFIGFAWLMDAWKFPKNIRAGGSYRRSRALFYWQFSLVSLLFLASVALTPFNFRGGFKEADQWIFPHIWHWLAMLVFLAGLAAPWILNLLLNGVQRRFSNSEIDLRALLIPADAPDRGNARLLESAESYPWHLSAGWINLIHSPLEFLLPAALWVVFSDGVWLTLVTSLEFYNGLYWFILLALLVTSALILMFAESSQRQAAVADTIRRTFHQGGLWITSLMALFFAICWFTGFSYIRTIMEGDRWVVIWYLLALYALFWCHQYWVNRFASEKVLEFFHPADQHQVSEAFMRKCLPAGVQEMVLRSERLGEADVKVATPDESIHYDVMIHGSSQLAVSRRGKAGDEEYGVFDRSDLIRRLMESLPAANQTEGQELLRELRLKTRAYFALLNIGIVLLFASLFVFAANYSNWSWVHWGDREAIVSSSQLADLDPEQKSRLKSLDKLLFDERANDTKVRPHVILIAASGGGTRAALYTSSVLNGLHRLDHLENVQLVSGVSGGGAALAYFASHRQELIRAKPDLDLLNPGASLAWAKFHERMAFPYITDVLRGGCEPRILIKTTIGELLAESFGRQFWKDGETVEGKFMGDLPIGLILNTTLAGCAPPDFEHPENTVFPLANTRYASRLHAGSRLILTNLSNEAAFPTSTSKGSVCDYLNYNVIQDPNIEVVKAAALNANFPPIFPNEPVDVTSQGRILRRYWVTDGGVQENRGEISMLFALRHTLQALKSTQRGSKQKKLVLPHLHIVVAEASAGSVQYNSDQGIAAASGAGAELANRLAFELETQVSQLYGDLGKDSTSEQAIKDIGPRDNPAKIRVHFLPMPSIFRIDGGIGTHWMLPQAVILGKTGLDAYLSGQSAQPIVLSKAEVMQIILDLHNDQHCIPLGKSGRERFAKVWEWIGADPLTKHQQQWQQLKEALRD